MTPKNFKVTRSNVKVTVMQKPCLLNILKSLNGSHSTWYEDLSCSVNDPYKLWGHYVKGQVHSIILCKNLVCSISWKVCEWQSWYKVGRLVILSRWPLYILRSKVKVTVAFYAKIVSAQYLEMFMSVSHCTR